MGLWVNIWFCTLPVEEIIEGGTSEEWILVMEMQVIYNLNSH